MSIDEAHTCAAKHATEKAWPDRDRAREMRSGWYFPWRFSGEPLVGSNGIIVDKRTRRVMLLGSAYPLERDLRAYDAGYPMTNANLVVSAVGDQERAVSLLQKLGVSKVEPEEAHGVTWRIPRRLSRAEIQARLVKLPADFGSIQVYFSVELLEKARQERCLSFELQEATV
jgi:hypothetical protein